GVQAGAEDRVDDVLPGPPVRRADAAATALPGLGQHQAGAGGQVLADALDPLRGIQVAGPPGVLEPDLAHDPEVRAQRADAGGLLGIGQRDGPVRDLDVAAPVVEAEGSKALEPSLEQELLEEG